MSEYHLRQNFPTYEDLAAHVADLYEVLDECADYMDDHSDVNDGDNGIPEPNKEMRLLSRIQEVM